MKRLLAALSLAAVAAMPVAPVVADPWDGPSCPAEPTRQFPASFHPPLDKQALGCSGAPNAWTDYHVGGWGGVGPCPANHVKHTPVVFVHGQGGDAWHWNLNQDSADGSTVNVRNRFLAAGYCPSELWAISYDGAVTPEGQIGAGYATHDDLNTDEVYQFILAVKAFTHSRHVDVIGHSLGVTVVRKALFNHRHDTPNPYTIVRHAIMIAGANHGTTTCRGEMTLDVCKEVQPGSPWLAELNAPGETPGPTKWLVVCDCTGIADDFYLGPDALSPLLEGAPTIRLPYDNHFQVGLSTTAIAAYLPFALAGSVAAEAARTTRATRPARTNTSRVQTRVLHARTTRALAATGIGEPVAPAAALLVAAALLLAWSRRRAVGR